MLEIIDPYEYRDLLTMPKLVLNSAGDQFFLPDSSQFGLVWASLIVLALTCGLLMSLRFSQPQPRAPSGPAPSEPQGEPTESPGSRAANASRSRALDSKSLPITASAPIAESRSMPNIASDDPPLELGEPLDADDDGASEFLPPEAAPVDIGPALDPFDPPLYETRAPIESRREPRAYIGDTLDADDPWGAPTVGEDPISIGLELDADSPGSSTEGHSAFPAAEIGVPLDAGTPKVR